jgi:YaiO family outer membrane protein
MKRCLSLLLGITAAAAQEEPPPRTEVEVGGTVDRLDEGYDDWSSGYLQASHRFKPHQTVYGTVRETERFERDDFEIQAGGVQPVDSVLSLTAEGSLSPTNRILPEWSAQGGVQFGFKPAWIATGALRHMEYESSGATLALAGVEHYFGPFRAAYTIYQSHIPEKGGWTDSHRAELAWYYAEPSRIGWGGSMGEEIEALKSGRVLVTEVRSVSLFGRHWLDAQWGLSWELTAHRQGDRYHREGALVGLRYAF